MFQLILILLFSLFLSNCAVNKIEEVSVYPSPIMDSVIIEKTVLPSSYHMLGSYGQNDYALFRDPTTAAGMIGTLAQAIGDSIQSSKASDFFGKVLNNAEIDIDKDFRNILEKKFRHYNVVKKIDTEGNYIIAPRLRIVGLDANKLYMELTVTSTKLESGIKEETHATFRGENRLELTQIARDPSALKSEFNLAYEVLSNQIVNRMKSFDFEGNDEY